MAATASWISKRPDRCGGDECIRDTRITVWGLVAYRRLGMSDDQILQAIVSLVLVVVGRLFSDGGFSGGGGSLKPPRNRYGHPRAQPLAPRPQPAHRSIDHP